MSELCGLADSCNYGPVLNDMLWDWLVVGVNDNHIQRRLLAEGDVSLEWAMELALGLEAAAKNACAIQGACFPVADRSSMGEVNKIVLKRPAVTAMDLCYWCGSSRHSPAQCKHKEVKSFNCRKIEHLAKVCQLDRSLKQSTSQPLEVTLEVEKQSITMEIDTGALVSVMLKEEHQKRRPNVNLEAAEVRLRTYTGKCFEVLGMRNVAIHY